VLAAVKFTVHTNEQILTATSLRLVLRLSCLVVHIHTKWRGWPLSRAVG